MKSVKITLISYNSNEVIYDAENMGKIVHLRNLCEEKFWDSCSLDISKYKTCFQIALGQSNNAK